MSKFPAYRSGSPVSRERPSPSCRYVAVGLGSLLAGLIPNAEGGSRAPGPVWRGSVKKPVAFVAMSKRQAVKLYHDARAFERRTRPPGRQDGAIGRNGLAVLHALLFDFLNYATGELRPSKRQIARRACISERSVARGLDNLKAAGVIHWVRRCIEEWKHNRFSLKQISNAYAVLPISQWLGFRTEPEAPAPNATAWGATPPLPDSLTVAAQEAAEGKNIAALCAALEADPTDDLAMAVARLGRNVIKRAETFTLFTGLPA